VHEVLMKLLSHVTCSDCRASDLTQCWVMRPGGHRAKGDRHKSWEQSHAVRWSAAKDLYFDLGGKRA
jgi:hypothetical protein